MAWGRKALLVTAAAALAGTATAQPANRGGPVATYWMSAATATGFGAGAQAGARPSMGQIMGMMNGGGGNVAKTLTLQLGSSRRPTGEPQADHLPPPSLGAGQQLPLLTPRAAPPAPQTPYVPHEYQKPKGRMLIFWGCGERARPGQPLVLDFAQMAEGKLPPGMQNLSQMFVSSQTPPAPGRTTTYGEWPNERTRINVPANGSLVGEHVVRGNYSPEIKFALGQNQDFMGPFNLTTNRKNPSGSGQLGWAPVQGAKAYHAVMMGGGENDTVVMWSSSEVQAMAMLPDYLSDGEISRLVTQKALMAPTTTSCAIPKEALDASPSGMVQMAAYGGEANFSYPPRPAKPPAGWAPEWVAKVRYKSTTGAILGMDMADMGGGGDDEGGRPRPGARPRPGQPSQGGRPAQQQPPRRPGLGDVIRGGLGLPGL
ncbi:hypothetical protein [Phenylobacterium sp.]|jgi:hypothetical protein|uniref:hypothetical protein n=1 Tax=Phenylobacterium sp. TaxID=1871053 RepID=UPI002E3551B9|nr:hypothetical protein [Phenylobacterium sp.]HEX2560238.1 hypothetical protein [Phenylobacterium sp.]